MDLKCAKCGSPKIVPDARILDQGNSSGGTLLVKFEKSPSAILFKGRVCSTLIARICADCGYTELYTHRPDVIYEAYQEAKSEEAHE